MDFLFWNLLLTSSSGGIKFAHLSEFTSAVHDIYNFENVVVISTENFPEKSGLHVFMKLVQSNLQAAVVSVCHPSGLKLWSILNHNNLAITFMETIKDRFLLNTTDVVLRGRHSAKIVIVLGEGLSRPEDLELIFEVCREFHLINVVLLFWNMAGDMQMFSYDLYPEISIRNLTGLKLEDVFVEAAWNVQGHTFRSPVLQDPPRVVKLSHNGNHALSGTAAITLLNFIQKINGTFQELVPRNFTQVNIVAIKEMILRGEVEIAIHPHGMYNFFDFSASYPLQIVPWCLIVPSPERVPDYMYLVLPLDTAVWCSLVVAIFYFSVVEYFTKRTTGRPEDFGYVWCSVLRQVLYISSCKISRVWRSACLELQVIFLGFIVSNVYNAFLTTFLTSSIDESPINTADDLVKKNLQVMIIDYESNSIVNASKDSFPSAFLNLLKRVDIEVFMAHRRSLNSSYAYTATSERWKFHFDQQKYLKRRPFRASDICFGTYFLTYGMSRDSPFLKALNHFILLVHETGLFLKWETNTFQDATKDGILRHITREDEAVHSLDLLHFTLTWYVLVFGLLLAIACFVLEKIIFWWKGK